MRLCTDRYLQRWVQWRVMVSVGHESWDRIESMVREGLFYVHCHAEAAMRGRVCQPRVRQPSFSSTR
jgi:hypothetical protein